MRFEFTKIDQGICGNVGCIPSSLGNVNTVLVSFCCFLVVIVVIRFKSEKKKLDLLVNNAAVMKCKRLQTSENIELQFGVNHLGHFLLTNLLLDELKVFLQYTWNTIAHTHTSNDSFTMTFVRTNLQAAQQSRIIVVADKDYVQGRISVDDLNSEKTYNKHDAYNRSKLANMLFVHELSQRLRGTGVTVNAVTSDHIDTALHRYRWYYNGFIWPFMYTFLKTPQGGAKCTLYVALKKSLKKTSGKCFRLAANSFLCRPF